MKNKKKKKNKKKPNSFLKLKVKDATKIFRKMVEYKHKLPPTKFGLPPVKEFVEKLEFEDEPDMILLKNIFDPAIKAAIIDLVKKDELSRNTYMAAMADSVFKPSNQN
jgi:hypothetical protein